MKMRIFSLGLFIMVATGQSTAMEEIPLEDAVAMDVAEQSDEQKGCCASCLSELGQSLSKCTKSRICVGVFGILFLVSIPFIYDQIVRATS